MKKNYIAPRQTVYPISTRTSFLIGSGENPLGSGQITDPNGIAVKAASMDESIWEEW